MDFSEILNTFTHQLSILSTSEAKKLSVDYNTPSAAAELRSNESFVIDDLEDVSWNDYYSSPLTIRTEKKPMRELLSRVVA